MRYTVQDAHIAKQEKNMKYKKGTFILVPNKEAIRGKPAELQIIYVWLCNYMDDEGNCFPSRSRLARECGCGIRTVDKYIQELVDLGIISKQERKQKNGSQNLSNMYSIILSSGADDAVSSVEKDTGMVREMQGGSVENSTVTQSIVTQSNLTHTTDTVEQKRLLGQLPDRLGKNAITRLGAIYRALWRKKYGTECTSINYGKFGKIIKMLLQKNTEAQITALLLTYFNWNGASDDNANEYKYLSDKGFPIELLPSKRDIFVAYLTNNRGVCYDNLQEVEGYVARNLKNIL